MTSPDAQIIAEAQTVWSLDVQPAGCPACRRAFLVEAARIGGPCPGCARGRLEAQPVLMRPEPPELLLPFTRRPADLRPALEAFVKEVWLRPDDFNADALLRRATPVLWPMWLVDGEVAGSWQAEMGFDYQVQSSQETYGSGGWTTRSVVETRTRWEPRCGEVRRRYHNAAVPALSDEKALTGLVGAYPLNEAQPYEAGAARGAAVRVPDIPPDSAWPLARETLERLTAQDCQTAAQAQHVRQSRLAVTHEQINWTQLLLPLYATYYTDDAGQPQMVLVNARTGRVGGRRLASQRKGWQWAGLLAGMALALLVLGLVVAAIGAVFPPLLALGGFLTVAAFAVGAAALAPALWPWQWNQRQKAADADR